MATIDPGVEGGIKDAATNHASDDLANQQEAETGDFHDPSRWWFASTACPLLAGTFGPIANGFSICALVVSWRLHIPEGQSEAFGVKIPDPPWLIVSHAPHPSSALKC